MSDTESSLIGGDAIDKHDVRSIIDSFGILHIQWSG